VQRRVLERRAQAEDRLLVGERLLGRAEALRDDVADAVIDHEVLGLDDLREAGDALGLRNRRLDEHDVRPGRHRVGVLDVEGALERPADHVVVVAVERWDGAGGLKHLQRRRVRQPEVGVELVQVLRDRR
jgi:hypothetical protein